MVDFQKYRKNINIESIETTIDKTNNNIITITSTFKNDKKSFLTTSFTNESDINYFI